MSRVWAVLGMLLASGLSVSVGFQMLEWSNLGRLVGGSSALVRAFLGVMGMDGCDLRGVPIPAWRRLILEDCAVATCLCFSWMALMMVCEMGRMKLFIWPGMACGRLVLGGLLAMPSSCIVSASRSTPTLPRASHSARLVRMMA